VVRRALEIHLRHQPTKPAEVGSNGCAAFADRNTGYGSASRIFDVIAGSTVEILAIVTKSEAETWLRQFGEPV
jgi:mRNA interferase RelE/StbE